VVTAALASGARTGDVVVTSISQGPTTFKDGYTYLPRAFAFGRDRQFVSLTLCRSRCHHVGYAQPRNFLWWNRGHHQRHCADQRYRPRDRHHRTGGCADHLPDPDACRGAHGSGWCSQVWRCGFGVHQPRYRHSWRCVHLL
jgi:hypothetical protein